MARGGAVLAGRQPGAIFLVAAFRCAGAAVVALPVAFALGRPTGAFPTGDAVLFEPGAELLTEVLRVQFDGLVAAVSASAALLLVVAFADIALTAALFVAIASGQRLRLGAWLGRAMALWPAFVGLWGVAVLVSGLAGLAIALLEGVVAVPLAARLSERGGDLLVLGVLAVGLLLLLGIGIVADLARGALVETADTLRHALRLALRTLRAHPGRVLLGWLAPALGSLAAVLMAAWLVGRAHLERGRWPDVAAVIMVHGLVILGITALRASWIARAVRLVGTTRAALSAAPTVPVGTPEDTGVLVDPS